MTNKHLHWARAHPRRWVTCKIKGGICVQTAKCICYSFSLKWLATQGQCFLSQTAMGLCDCKRDQRQYVRTFPLFCLRTFYSSLPTFSYKWKLLCVIQSMFFMKNNTWTNPLLCWLKSVLGQLPTGDNSPPDKNNGHLLPTRTKLPQITPH